MAFIDTLFLLVYRYGSLNFLVEIWHIIFKIYYMNEDANFNKEEGSNDSEGVNPNIKYTPKKEKRPRINKDERMAGAFNVDDRLEYKANKSTQRGREIEAVPSKINNSIWFDQHYVGRDTLGENDGTPRDGIDAQTVKALIIKAFNHLMYYTSTLDNFYFANCENGKKPRRILIQNSYSSAPILNVLIETHFIDFHKYETTVKTAMCKDDFIPFDPQYIVEITDDYSSNLKLYAAGKYRDISSIET